MEHIAEFSFTFSKVKRVLIGFRAVARIKTNIFYIKIFFILYIFILFLKKNIIRSDIRHSCIHLYSVHSLQSSLLLPLIIVGSLITVRALSITNIIAIFETKPHITLKGSEGGWTDIGGSVGGDVIGDGEEGSGAGSGARAGAGAGNSTGSCAGLCAGAGSGSGEDDGDGDSEEGDGGRGGVGIWTYLVTGVFVRGDRLGGVDG
jgi:hypothetical protein